ncbi:MAG: glutamyl-tRNA reductase [Cellvibrionaceae bacterium]|nr:glutamyl-tRNA reductase [Cellvibrionaceae bacterium]
MLPLFVIGINHQSAALSTRERVSFAPEAVTPALQSLLSDTSAAEAAILSTCNRTELYLVDRSSAAQDLAAQYWHWLSVRCQLDQAVLCDVGYVHVADSALTHTMQVACGLDSMVLGEPQILGQMKSCYAVAQAAGTLGSQLHLVFQKAFSAAKQVRTKTAIGRSPVSVAYAAVALSRRIFADLQQETALLIGAGDTIDLVARHLQDQGIAKMIFANRTLARAQALAREFAAQAILLADIPQSLVEADIVISSTASQLPILGKGAVESALKQRKHRPIFMVDIAVPRDIEPEVGALNDIYLYTIDDLHDVIDVNKQSRAAAAAQAQLIVDDCVASFLRDNRTRESVAVIKSYRQQAEQLRDQAVKKALRDLNKGVAPEHVVQQMAVSLTNKLLHKPTQQLKQASMEGQREMLALSQQVLGVAAPKKSS